MAEGNLQDVSATDRLEGQTGDKAPIMEAPLGGSIMEQVHNTGFWSGEPTIMIFPDFPTVRPEFLKPAPTATECWGGGGG